MVFIISSFVVLDFVQLPEIAFKKKKSLIQNKESDLEWAGTEWCQWGKRSEGRQKDGKLR